MGELTIKETQEINGGVVFLIPPAVTIGVKVLGIGIGIVGSSIATFSAYRSLYAAN